MCSINYWNLSILVYACLYVCEYIQTLESSTHRWYMLIHICMTHVNTVATINIAHIYMLYKYVWMNTYPRTPTLTHRLVILFANLPNSSNLFYSLPYSALLFALGGWLLRLHIKDSLKSWWTSSYNLVGDPRWKKRDLCCVAWCCVLAAFAGKPYL